MGLVFEARDTRLKRSVAIKEMKPEFAGDPVAKVMFLREARAAATVRHEHIVPIYHVGEQDGIPFLVMPLLQGESLATRLDRGPLSPNEAIRIGREIAQGLAAAHEAGLIHRDIKPANIWLESPRDRVLLLDFGLARISDSEETISRPGTILGTPAYLSPEQAAGIPMDHRADLFSLGVTLYHATTGQRPFQGETLTKTLRAVTSYHPPPPRTLNSEVPSWLSDTIMKLMAKQPGDRPASAAGVFDEPAPSTLPTPAVVSAAPAEQPGTASSKQTWAFLGIAAIVGVAVVVWLATR
jgi:serine/threonine protein kinase